MINLIHCKKNAVVALTALLTACVSLAPDYKAPELAIPTHFKESDQDSLKSWSTAEPKSQLSRGVWWTEFNDPLLNELVSTTLDNNFQLKVALARYESVVAFLGFKQADQYPQINAFGMLTTNRQSIDRPLRSKTQPTIYNNNQLYGAVSYELDLWGRVKNNVTSAKAQVQAAESELESVRLVIQANVINTYFVLRSLDTQLDLVDRHIAEYQRQTEFIAQRFKKGVTKRPDLYRVQTLLEQARIHRNELKIQRAQREHALALLLGEPASTFSLPKGSIDAITLPTIPLYVPSKLLERRPDIARAERIMAAKNAEIGVARAAYFPVISLSALGGFNNAHASNFLHREDTFWTLGPTALLTVFDAGRRGALVDQAMHHYEEAAAHYKDVVMNAFKETEDILVDLRLRRESMTLVDQVLELSKKNYDVATARYSEGAASYLDIVDAALQKSQAQYQRIQFQTQQLVSSTLLVKALGGYWEEDE